MSTLQTQPNELPVPPGVTRHDPDGFILSEQQFRDDDEAKKYAGHLADHSVGKLRDILRQTQEKVQQIQASTKLTKDGKRDELTQVQSLMHGKIEEAGLGHKKIEQDLRKTEDSLGKSLIEDDVSSTRAIVRDETMKVHVLNRLQELSSQDGTEARDGQLLNGAEQMVLESARGRGDFKTVLGAIEAAPFGTPVRDEIIQRAKDEFLARTAPDAFKRRQMLQSVQSLYRSNLQTARTRLTEITGIQTPPDDPIARQAAGKQE